MRVEITSTNVQKMQLATKVDDEGDLIVKVSIESKLHPTDIARLLNLQKNGSPLFFSIGSQQAQLDLGFFDIKSEPVEKTDEPSGPVECPQCRGAGTSLDKETRMDIACSVCHGTGLVPVTVEALASDVPVASVNPDDNGTAPKRRGRKPNLVGVSPTT